MKILLALTFAILLTACNQENGNAHELLGKWTGPEGTFLELSQTGDTYAVTVQNLDGPRTFPAMVSGGTVTFDRDGKTETITKGSGADTGMKWLADKSDCVVITMGEGYCRD